MSFGKSPLLYLILVLLSAPLPAQTVGILSAEGSGSGATRSEALEAAKIAAVNALVVSAMKRDTVYRDLFLSEAFKNDWFEKAEADQAANGRWQAAIVISVDEGIAEALYFGRYSTTVGSLLDQADSAAAELESLLAEGGSRESNGDLGGAESAFRRAESKADEALRYIGPVEDAVFFSSIGKRKAPELKAVISSLRVSSREGVERIRASQERLSVAIAFRNVIETLDSIEAELAATAAIVDELYPIASSPASYERALLQAASSRAGNASDSLARRRALLIESSKDLSPEMEYPRARAALALDRIDSLTRSLRSAASSVNSELFRRSTPVRAAAWIAAHEPREYAAFGFYGPLGIKPGAEGPEPDSLPWLIEGRAEGAFPVGSFGFWSRTVARLDTERISPDAEHLFLSQGIDVGLFARGLVGLGFRWEWIRRDGSSALDPISALSFTFGSAGQSLGTRRTMPLWITTLSWELPRGEDDSVVRNLNLAAESILRPSRWIRLEAGAAARAREADYGSLVHLATARLGLGFRLPVLMPLVWRLGWEGNLRSEVDGDDVDWSGAEADGAFRFGLEYTF